MRKFVILSAVPVLAAVSQASAGIVQIRVTVENLASANSVALAPLRFGFGNGTFDTFNNGQVAFNSGDVSMAPIVTVAEGGSGSKWLPAFAAAEPTANIYSLTGPGGPFLPGQSNSAVFSVDTANRYFSFGSMVVPSNDRFIGNDDPKEYAIFDANGNLVNNTIVEKGSDVWDAGSETDNPLNAAFLAIGNNDLRENQNGVVGFNNDFSAYNGLTTAAGYTFNAGLLGGNDNLVRITFAVVPEPATPAVLALAGLTALRRRRV